MADLPEPWGHGENITGTAFSSKLMGMWKPQARTRFPLPLFTADQLEAYAAAKVAEERERVIKIIEAYRVPVGNSAAGEMACDWTLEALREIRAAIRGTEAASA